MEHCDIGEKNRICTFSSKPNSTVDQLDSNYKGLQRTLRYVLTKDDSVTRLLMAKSFHIALLNN